MSVEELCKATDTKAYAVRGSGQTGPAPTTVSWLKGELGTSLKVEKVSPATWSKLPRTVPVRMTAFIAWMPSWLAVTN